MRAPLAVVTALLLLPFAAAQDGPPQDAAADDATRPATTITFYGHVFGTGLNAPMPANTVPPIGDALQSTWFRDQCGVADSPIGSASCDSDPVNKLLLFATAGPVQVHTAQEFNYSALHNERGHAKDVYLDTTQSITATFYAAADYFSWPVICNNGGPMPQDVVCPWPQWGWDPGVIPNFVVEATLYQAELGEYGQGASEPPPIAESIATAEVIGHGATEPQNLQTGTPDSPNVMEFTVDLGPPQVPIIQKEKDFFIVYSWYELVNGQKVGVEYMKPWAGEQFPVRFTLPVRNPFDVELVIPQFLHDKVVIHGVLSTPWGSYDIDQSTAVLTLRDSAGQLIQPQNIERFGDYQVAHGAHFKPVNFTWVWDHRADGARPGAYSASISACNLQNSACSTTDAAFTLGPGGTPGQVRIGRSGQATATAALLRDLTAAQEAQPLQHAAGPEGAAPQAPKGAPGPEAAVLLAGLAAVALAARRRR